MLSTWLNAGADPTEVAERSGNSVEVLLTRYAKCLDGRQDAADRRIEDLLREYERQPCPHPRHLASRPGASALLNVSAQRIADLRNVLYEICQDDLRVQRADHSFGQRTRREDVTNGLQVDLDFVVVLGPPLKRLR